MKSLVRSEDGLALVFGLLIVALGLLGITGTDLLGWAPSTKVWIDPARAITPVSSQLTWNGTVSVLALFLFLAVLFGLGALGLGLSPRKFLARFAVLFALTFACWFLGHNAFLAATPNERAKFGITTSLGLTGEAGYLIALLVGLLLSNFFPRVAEWLRPAARPEWFIKAGIVILGASLGVKAAEARGLVTTIFFRGLAAIIEAYLIYWALVYLIARRVFGFSREWSAPLASGISICGVSAAITTGAAIRARPVVPVMVSSLVVVFSVVELLLLPMLAQNYLAHEPMVAAAWMGLAVKTDGAAVSSGAITEALIRAQALENGTAYQAGWMLMTTTTVKVFIDLFIGVWALVLGVVWTWGIERREGQRVPVAEIFRRFPKFVVGYLLTFLGLLGVGLYAPETLNRLKSGAEASDVFRKIFFALTFMSIGLASDFRKLWEEGLGRLALVYIVCLFGFIIWIGLVISWLFFQGVLPPLAASTGG